MAEIIIAFAAVGGGVVLPVVSGAVAGAVQCARGSRPPRLGLGPAGLCMSAGGAGLVYAGLSWRGYTGRPDGAFGQHPVDYLIAAGMISCPVGLVAANAAGGYRCGWVVARGMATLARIGR